MPISPILIEESKFHVQGILLKYFDATEGELDQFANALESEEDWTCGFEDELLPLFLQIRNMCKTCEDITLYPDEQCPDCKNEK
jgi:hypothetical protein